MTRKDGHIGSLYPGRKETLNNDGSSFVLSVDKVFPNSSPARVCMYDVCMYGCTVFMYDLYVCTI